MKMISQEYKDHMGGELTTLAELIRITRTDNVVIAFTSHDADIVMNGVTYHADGAFSSGKLSLETALKTKDYDVTGFLDSATISEADIQAGLYDHARIDVFLCNWADLSQGVMQIRRGWIGEVALSGGQYIASLRGFHDLLNRKVGETYSPECRFDLGDARCGLNASALTVQGTVTGVIDTRRFADVARTESAGAYTDAKLTWVTGANAGTSGEVCAWDAQTHTLTLWLPPVHAVAVGDAYSLMAGCDKRFSTCCSRFANSINYGGFPYLPGLNRILHYPDS